MAENIITCDMCKSINITTSEILRRTGAPKGVKQPMGRLVSYGYRYKEHSCNDCNHVWEGEKII